MDNLKVKIKYSHDQGVSILALIWNNINYLKIILDKYLQMKYV
jgi:hypothetical protein